MWLSIQGMYEYDDTIFDGLVIPTYTDADNVIHVIDKSTVINNICLKCAELELIYSKIDTMKLAIGVWSVSNQETWRKMIETQYIKYNPIWNVDADETEKLQHGHTETRTLDYDDTTTRGTTDTTTRGTTETRTPNLTDTQRPNTANTESVKGFNSNTWSEAKKVESSGYATYEQHGTEATAHTGVDTVSYTGVDTLSHDGTDTMAHTGIDTTTKRRTGNIGVTTTQKMIAEQREVAEFNIIDYITESFKNRFCLLVY